VYILKACDSALYQTLEVFTLFVISGFRRDVDETFALLGHYAASSGNPLPILLFLDYLNLQDGIDTLSRNVGKALTFDAA
jgi:hypothetical protein